MSERNAVSDVAGTVHADYLARSVSPVRRGIRARMYRLVLAAVAVMLLTQCGSGPATQIVDFNPQSMATMRSGDRFRGQCSISAFAQPQRAAYRCAGNGYVLDPCFNPSVGTLTCPDFVDEKRVIAKADRRILRTSAAPHQSAVWAMVLASGARCQLATELHLGHFRFWCGNLHVCSAPDISNAAGAYFVRCADVIVDGTTNESRVLVKTAFL